MSESAFGNLHHEPGSFLPPDYARDFWVDFMRRQEHLMEAWLGPRELRRQGHSEVTPFTAAELKDRTKAVREWTKLTKRLVKRGYLAHCECYDCGGELVPSTETEHREWVYDETEDEWLARVEGEM